MTDLRSLPPLVAERFGALRERSVEPAETGGPGPLALCITLDQ